MSPLQLTIVPTLENIKYIANIFKSGENNINLDKNRSILLSCLALDCKEEFESLINLFDFNQTSIADTFIDYIINENLDNSYAEILINALIKQGINTGYDNYFTRDLPYLIKALENNNYELFLILYRGKNYLEQSQYFLYQPPEEHQRLTYNSANKVCARLISACNNLDLLRKIFHFIEQYKLADLESVYNEFSVSILKSSPVELWPIHASKLWMNKIEFCKDKINTAVKASLFNFLAECGKDFDLSNSEGEFVIDVIDFDVPLSDKAFETVLINANNALNIKSIYGGYLESNNISNELTNFLSKLLCLSNNFYEKYIAYVRKYSVSRSWFFVLLDSGKMDKEIAKYSISRIFIDNDAFSGVYNYGRYVEKCFDYIKKLISQHFISKLTIYDSEMMGLLNYLVHFNNDILIKAIKDGIIHADDDLVVAIQSLKKSSRRLQSKILELVE